MPARNKSVRRFATSAVARDKNAEPITDDIVIVKLTSSENNEPGREEIDELGVSWLAPVIVDQSGAESYPTGQVTVRFEREPTKRDLQRVAREYQLEVVHRNEFAPSQVVFAPRAGTAVFLPKKADELRDDPVVSDVWLNTTSRYNNSGEAPKAGARADRKEVNPDPEAIRQPDGE